MRVFKLSYDECSGESTVCETDSLPKGCVAALGCFDGVHIGHRALIGLAAATAEDSNRTAVWCLRGGKPFTLASEARQLSLFAEAGAGYAVFEDFLSIRDLSAERFVADYLKGELCADGAVCGFNFRFAAGRAADADDLVRLCGKYGMRVKVAPAVTVQGGEIVSSSRIRAAVEDGRVKDAAAMLGRYYSLEAPVIEGKHLGTRIGIPTLNQHIPDGMTVPKKGIYISFCTVGGKRLRSITNIGVRPTVETTEDILCESNILDETGDMYGAFVTLELCDYRREEQKFSSVEELRDTIRRDIEARYAYSETD